MKQWILKRVTGASTISFLVLSNTVFAIMLLVTIPQLEAFSNGLKIFDVMPSGYSTEYAFELLNKLGIEGREYYRSFQLPLDLLYPLFYAIANSFLFVYLLKKMKLTSKWSLNVILLPVLAAFFDYIENGCILFMLLNVEDLESWHVTISSVFTVLKSICTTLYFTLLIAFFVAHIIRKKHKAHSSNSTYQ